MGYVNDVKKIPAAEHWVILTYKTITIPGDERSRTNPGHGYPESTEQSFSYEVFTDEAVFIKELESRVQGLYKSDDVIGLHVTQTFGKHVVVHVRERRKTIGERGIGPHEHQWIDYEPQSSVGDESDYNWRCIVPGCGMLRR